MKFINFSRRLFSTSSIHPPPPISTTAGAKSINDKLKKSLMKKLDKHLEKATKESYVDPDVNTKTLYEYLEQFKTDLSHNDYIKLIEHMKEMKEKQEKILGNEDLESILSEYEKEYQDSQIGKKENIRFIRPPKTFKEALETLKDVDKRFEANKSYLYGLNDHDAAKINYGKKEEAYDPLRNTPKGISLQCLYYPPSKSEIILVGLKRKTIIHSSFIYDLLQEMKPESVFVQLPPDLPLFIRSKDKDYKTSWLTFLKKNKEFGFHVNPKPKFTTDVILNHEKMKKVIEHNIIPSSEEFELGSNVIYTTGKNMMEIDLNADAFFTPFLYCYNTLDSKIQLVLGDKPMIIQREMAGKTMKIVDAKNLFDKTCYEWENSNFNFNPQIQMKEIFIDPRVEYMTEVLRQLAHTSKKIVAVVDHDLMPYIEDKWKYMGKNLRPLEQFFKNTEEEEKQAKNKLNQDTFLEFIEKQVMMDVMFEPFLFKNFIQYKSFPFDYEGFLGSETALLNVFTFWSHYQEKYLKKMKNLAILEEDYDRHIKEEGIKLK